MKGSSLAGLLLLCVAMSSLACYPQDDAVQLIEFSRPGAYTQHPNYAIPNSNYFFTWKGFDGKGRPENAEYVWCGRSLGVGSQGFASLTAELRKLPMGSDVVAYPYYGLKGIGRDRPRSYPFGIPAVAFEDIVRDRNMRIVICSEANARKHVAGLEE